MEMAGSLSRNASTAVPCPDTNMPPKQHLMALHPATRPFPPVPDSQGRKGPARIITMADVQLLTMWNTNRALQAQSGVRPSGPHAIPGLVLLFQALVLPDRK